MIAHASNPSILGSQGGGSRGQEFKTSLTMRTHGHGGEHYTLGSVGGNRGGIMGSGELGRDSIERNARHR